MIRRLHDNRITGKPSWTYETLAYNASVIEDMLYTIALSRKERGKLLYIAICGYDKKAIAGVKVQESDLYVFNGKGRMSCLVLYSSTYKIRFSSFATVSVISVK